MSVILITGASTGIGNLAARELARAGHTVFAAMRALSTRNAGHAAELRDLAIHEGLNLDVVELDVESQDSADAAIAFVLERAGGLDVVVHNAGHLVIGYIEAFTPEEVAHLIDVNAVGAHRVNRAALPHLRQQRRGTLVYVGSTIPITSPPFLGPYVASKAAMDALAVVTAYEVAPLGIETTILMPGALIEGTSHFPNASRASDVQRAAAYRELDPMVARNAAATAGLFAEGVNAGPGPVVEEMVRLLQMPFGTKPFRSVVDATDSGVGNAVRLLDNTRENFVVRMGYADVLDVAQHKAVVK